MVGRVVGFVAGAVAAGVSGVRQDSHWFNFLLQAWQSLSALLEVGAPQTTHLPMSAVNTMFAHLAHNPAKAVADAMQSTAVKTDISTPRM